MRRLQCAADARDYLLRQAQGEGRRSIPYSPDVHAWLRTYRKKTRGLPHVQLLENEDEDAGQPGQLEYAGILFVPPQAAAAHVYVLWGIIGDARVQR